METQVKEAPVQAPPQEPVPIMVELTKEDKETAAPYVDNHYCIVCTALRRMGHRKVYLCTSYGMVDGTYYEFDGARGEDLWDSHEKRYYDHVVGKQIILYPRQAPPEAGLILRIMSQ